MADRGRDLKFSILSDVDQFDTERPARGLEDLADAATAAGKRVDGLSDSSREMVDKLGAMIDQAKRAKGSVDTLGDQSHTTARKVDDAFDRIAKSSKSSSHKVDDATDRMGDSLHDVGQEAGGTAREMAASFSGGVDDINDAAQELLANAGETFGPAGIAIGVALASGFALFRKRQEEIEAAAQELTDRLIEDGGRLQKESVFAKLQEFTSDGTITDLSKQARDAGINVDDFLLAVAGDPAALERTHKALATIDAKIQGMDLSMAGTDPTMVAFFNGLNAVKDKLGEQSDALATARRRYDLYAGATARAGKTAQSAAAEGMGAWDNLRSHMSAPIKPTLDLDDAPFYRKLSAAQRARARVMADFDRTGDYRSRP